MKKLTAVLIVAALACAAVASAGGPPKKTKQQQATAKNAAQFCKQLRAANPTLFSSTFGTNANKANAYGKCVSAKAKSKTTNPTVTLKNVVVRTTGTVTQGGAPNCQFTAAGCTLSSAGVITGPFAGTYTATFTILYQSPNTRPNGQGGFCAPATGTVVLTFTGLGTITKSETGEVCEVGATGVNVPHTFTGTFTVQSGTGLFAGATGTGPSSFAQQPGPAGSAGGAVTAQETFETLALKL